MDARWLGGLCLLADGRPKTLRRINKLIQDILRDPYHGIGKPEPLRYDLSDYWSRRINETDRIVYKISDDILIIVKCRTHYE